MNLNRKQKIKYCKQEPKQKTEIKIYANLNFNRKQKLKYLQI